MRTALAIIERDLKERRFIFIAALILGFVPFISLAIVPSLRANPRDFVAIFTAGQLFFMPLAVALGLGSSMIGSDLTAGRLSFYFSKPISPRSLWYGKLAAALVTIYVAMVLAAAPGTIFTWNYRYGQWMDRRTVFLASVIVAPIVLLLVHVLSTMLRSRSAWIALDAIGVATTAAFVYWILRPVYDAEAMWLFIALLTFMSGALLVTLIVSGAWHLARGRIDRRANHNELSKLLWASIASILVIAAAYAAVVEHAPLRHTRVTSLYAAPAGAWVAATGSVPYGFDYRATQLVNLETGKIARMSNALQYGALAFSRDGRHVAWTQSFHEGVKEIVTRSLDPIGTMTRTGIETSENLELVMSDNGARLAYIDRGILNVADAGTGRSLASVRVNVPSRWFSWTYFVNPDVVRFIVAKEMPEPRNVARLNTLDIFELDVPSRHWTHTGSFGVMARYTWASATPDGTRIFINSMMPADQADAFFIVDARTGARLLTLPPAPFNAFVPFNDSVVSFARSSDGLQLRQQALNGQEVRTINLGEGSAAHVIAARGTRLLVWCERDRQKGAFEGLLVDMATGSIVRRMPGIRLAPPHHMWEDDPRVFVPSGPLVAGVDKADHIIRINLEDGTVRPLPQ